MNEITTHISDKITFNFLFKIVFFYLFFFLLLYIEPFSIGGRTIGVLWKIAFLAAVLLPVSVYIFKRKTIEPFVLFAILLSIKMLFNISSFEYFNSTISLVAKNLMFPMLFLFFIIKLNTEQLIYFAKHFSILIVLSFVPYLIGILNPIAEGYDLSAYGVKESFGLLGVFHQVHAAGISLGIALVVLFYFFQEEKNKTMRLIYILLIGLGTYEIILTYVRTGLLMALIGIFYLWMKEKESKKYITAIYFIVPAIFLVTYMYITNPVLQMRIFDENIYNKHRETGLDRLGSGRIIYAKTALVNWYEEGSVGHLMGLGFEYGKIKMGEAIGNKIFAHNNYVQMLQQEGLMGFVLFLLYLYSLLRYILRRKTNKFYSISMALALAYLAEMLVQGNFLFPMFLLISIFLALMKKTEIEYER